MENGREEAQMNQEELKQVAGGNIIDDIGCAIKGHNFILEEGYITGHFQYSYFKCKRCGEKNTVNWITRQENKPKFPEKSSKPYTIDKGSGPGNTETGFGI